MAFRIELVGQLEYKELKCNLILPLFFSLQESFSFFVYFLLKDFFFPRNLRVGECDTNSGGSSHPSADFPSGSCLYILYG